jgi:hypothetical protein
MEPKFYATEFLVVTDTERGIGKVLHPLTLGVLVEFDLETGATRWADNAMLQARVVSEALLSGATDE